MNLSMILKRSLAIKPHERVLIITDSREKRIAKKFFIAAKNLSNNTSLLLKPIGRYHGEEPPLYVAEKMLSADVIIAVTTHSLTHSKARINASDAGARTASLPGFTEKMFSALQISPHVLKNNCEKIKKVLQKTDKIRILTKTGTNISFSIKNRTLISDDGLFIKKKMFGNLPAGEVFVAPLEHSANGLIVIHYMGKNVKQGTIVKINKGVAIAISDKKCKLAKIFSTVKNSTNIAEFGIGTNPKAKLIGKILQDEKVKGTCHIAFGNNTSFGGKIYSSVHLDAILFKPTIYADEKVIMKNGRLLI